MKYKVGDKVKIREDLKINNEYDNMYFNSEMSKHRGQIATIKRADLDNTYKINLDDGDYWWTDAMFEDVEEEELKEENRIDIGFHLVGYCGFRVIEGAIFNGFDEDKAEPHICFTKDGIPYTLPIDAIDWTIPHED